MIVKYFCFILLRLGKFFEMEENCIFALFNHQNLTKVTKKEKSKYKDPVEEKKTGIEEIRKKLKNTKEEIVKFNKDINE